MEKQLIDIPKEDLKILNKVCLDIDSGRKHVKVKYDKKYIRGNTNELRSQCPNCRKVFYKNNPWQIVYFCSKTCRLEYKSIPVEFEVIK